MTAAQRRLVASRLDRIGQAILGSAAELGRVECPQCEQRALTIELLGTGLAITCGSPALVHTEDNKGLCMFRHVVFSVSSTQLPTLALEKTRVVAPKPTRRRVR